MQVGRVGGLLLGAQCAPGLPFGSLFSSLTNDTERAVVANRCQDSLSYAVAYQPEGQSAYGEADSCSAQLAKLLLLQYTLFPHPWPCGITHAEGHAVLRPKQSHPCISS